MPVAERITDDWEYRLHNNTGPRGGESFGLWIHGPDEEYPVFSETGENCIRFNFQPDGGSDGEPVTDEFLDGLATFYDHIEGGGRYREVETVLIHLSKIERWAAVHAVMNLQSSQTVPTLKPLLNRALTAREDVTE